YIIKSIIFETRTTTIYTCLFLCIYLNKKILTNMDKCVKSISYKMIDKKILLLDLVYMKILSQEEKDKLKLYHQKILSTKGVNVPLSDITIEPESMREEKCKR